MSNSDRGAVTVQPRQPWEAVASPGHPLFRAADILGMSFQPLYLKASLLLLAVPVALWFATTLGGWVGDGVAKLVAFALWLRMEHFAGALAVASAGLFAWVYLKTRGLNQKLRRTLIGLSGLLLAGAVIWFGYLVAKDLIGGKDEATAAVEATPVPRLAPLAYVEFKGSVEMYEDSINMDRVRDLMVGWTAAIDAGRAIPANECTTDKKVIEPWLGEADFMPRCRLSADKTRLWVWGYALASKETARNPYAPQVGPYAVLAYKTKSNGWTIANLANLPGRQFVYMNLSELEGQAIKEAQDANPVDSTSVGTLRKSEARRAAAEAIVRERFNFDPRRIPRSMAADLPELSLDAPAAKK